MNKPIYQNNKILFSINAREKPKRQWIIGMIKKKLCSQTLAQHGFRGTHIYIMWIIWQVWQNGRIGKV